ncbi:pilus assembly protein PilQ [Legionella antarctica]|uniref:Pilus assembly protein PilQ n=2 Tax=Legionella antarctica TaxID=2708020 RepID=A0A6F8T7A1_9GAMM|nr:pilus assembly protein PilQ [Legionella antarctica]
MLELSRTVSYSGSVAGRVYSLVLNGKSNEIFEPAKEVFITNQVVNAKHSINHIDFRGIEKQGGRVLINVSDTSIPIDVTQTGKEVVVNFLNTKIPQQLMKRFDVSDFHSPAQVITMQQDRKNVRMTILNKGDYGHFVYQINNQFMVDIFPLTAEELHQAKLKKQVFTGKRISLNFQNINIRAVLQLLADFTGVNMVVSDNVKGDITLRLNDIPWDQALDIILTTQGLDKRRTGNVMLIDTKANLDKMEESKLKSQQIIQKLEPIRSDLLQINYAKAADLAILIKDKQNSLLSEKGKLSVDARTNTIWIQDTGTKIEEVRDLIKQLDIPVKQVLIEARIVEVSKDFSQDIGIRWGISRSPTLSGSLAGANQMQQAVATANVAPFAAAANVTPFTDRLNLDLIAAPANLANPATLGIALAKINDNILLDLELSALESEGRAELISSPRLITINQQAALIESGQEIPYQEATSSGATAVAFKKAVLSLKVTPQITPDNKILMDLQINQDTASPQTFNGVPAILTKEIQTNVLVNNGQTIVLGGIYTQDKTKTINRIPFFGELPVVGVLFRNKQVGINNNELLIFITPKIITNSLSITTIEGREKEVYK